MIFVDDYNWRVHAKFQPTILGPNTACSKFGFQGVKLYSMLFSKYNKVKAWSISLMDLTVKYVVYICTFVYLP